MSAAAPSASVRPPPAHHRYLVSASGLKWAVRYDGAVVDTFPSRQTAVDVAKALASFRMAGKGSAEVLVQIRRGEWTRAWRSEG